MRKFEYFNCSLPFKEKNVDINNFKDGTISQVLARNILREKELKLIVNFDNKENEFYMFYGVCYIYGDKNDAVCYFNFSDALEFYNSI